MKTKIYSIVYQNDQGIQEFESTCYSLQKTIDKFVTEGGKVLCIVAKEPKTVEKKSKDINKVEKQRFYNNKYSNYYKKFKNGKINENEFLKIKQILKQLKENCKTSNEFEKKFSKYKKSTNNIPPYNVSD